MNRFRLPDTCGAEQMPEGGQKKKIHLYEFSSHLAVIFSPRGEKKEGANYKEYRGPYGVQERLQEFAL